MFIKHWQIKDFTLALAEAMPTEGYGFKPTLIPKKGVIGNVDSSTRHIKTFRRPYCQRP
jgi:hypothetical protein